MATPQAEWCQFKNSVSFPDFMEELTLPTGKIPWG